MGAVLYVFLPADLHISYPALIGIFAVAMTIGVTSHVPGGLGVFEAAILFLVPPPPALLPAVVSALVMFRFVYYFLPLVLGGVAVAVAEGLRHRRRLRALTESVTHAGPPVVPIVFAMLVFMAGTILLASSALPGTGWRLALLNNYMPQSLLEGAHLISAIAGTLLLLLGRALSRRLSEAWWVTETLLAFSSLIALAKGLEYEVAALFGLLFIALLPCRPQFYRRGRLIDQRLTPVWMLGITAVVIFMCWLLAFVYRHLDYSQTALMQFDLQRHAPRSLRATVAMLATLAIVLLWQAVRATQQQSGAGGEIDYRRLRRVVAQSTDSRAHLALTGDKSILWFGLSDAFLMYGMRGRSWVGIGDPIGHLDSWSDLIWDLRDLADQRGGRVVFFDIGNAALPIYFDLGLQAVTLGRRSRLSLPQFDPHQWLATAVAASSSDTDPATMAFEICRGEQVDGIMSDLATISDIWLESQHLREQRILRGAFSRDYVAHCPVAILRQGGRIVAFAVLWCAADRAEIAIDLLRWSPATSSATPYRLLVETLAWAKAVGYQQLDLGLQPDPQHGDPRLASLWQEILQGDVRPMAAGEKATVRTAAGLLLHRVADLPMSHEASYLLYPIGQLTQSLRALSELISINR
jgi:phosphatidylglycerol lysyltransferase